MIRSSEILARTDADTTQLHRWREAGYITPTVRYSHGNIRSRNQGQAWPDHTIRMVALLLTDPDPHIGRSNQAKDTRRELLQGVACCLAEHPEVPYAVAVDGGPTRPAWTAEEVDRLCADVTLHAEVVCIP